MTAIEKMVSYSKFPEEEACHTLGGHLGKQQGSQEAEGIGELWTGDYIVISAKKNR